MYKSSKLEASSKNLFEISDQLSNGSSLMIHFAGDNISNILNFVPNMSHQIPDYFIEYPGYDPTKNFENQCKIRFPDFSQLLPFEFALRHTARKAVLFQRTDESFVQRSIGMVLSEIPHNTYHFNSLAYTSSKQVITYLINGSGLVIQLLEHENEIKDQRGKIFASKFVSILILNVSGKSTILDFKIENK